MLTEAKALKLYDDPVLAYNEIAATIAPGDRYVQDFDYSVIEKPACVSSEYLEVLYPLSPVTDGDIDSWQIDQGSLGNCGTMANIAGYASISQDSEWALERGIYPLAPSAIGLYLVRVCDPDNATGIKWVAIDSKVPTDVNGKFSLVDGGSKVLAIILLVKAACTMKGGCFDEITNSAQLRNSFSWWPNILVMASNFADFKHALDAGGNAVFSMSQQLDAAGGEVTPSGVVYGHAFAVVDAIEGEGYQLVRIENPWSGGSDYASPYADDSPFWDEHPELAQKKADAKAALGNYWIDWQTFCLLSGKTIHDLRVPLPYSKYPSIVTFRHEFTGNPSVGQFQRTRDRVKELFLGLPQTKLTVTETCTLNLALAWLKGSGNRHMSIKIVDANGVILQSTSPECWWGHGGLRSLTFSPGEYFIVPYTWDWDTDRGVLEIQIYSESAGWVIDASA
jgi:hypothetical protein